MKTLIIDLKKLDFALVATSFTYFNDFRLNLALLQFSDTEICFLLISCFRREISPLVLVSEQGELGVFAFCDGDTPTTEAVTKRPTPSSVTKKRSYFIVVKRLP